MSVADTIDRTALDHWRADPISFIETVLFDPETGKPFVLLEAEKKFLAHAFKRTPPNAVTVYGTK